MTPRLIKQVANGEMPLACINVPFRIVAESCSSNFQSSFHWIYFIQIDSSCVGKFDEEHQICELTAQKLISNYHMKSHIDTYDRMLFIPDKNQLNVHSN